MVDEMGLGSFRKKRTERPENVVPKKADENERTMPEDLLKLPEKLRTKDLAKSVRLPVNTHTAIATIATLKNKRIYEVINDLVEGYVSDLPTQEKKIIKSSIETVANNFKKSN